MEHTHSLQTECSQRRCARCICAGMGMAWLAQPAFWLGDVHVHRVQYLDEPERQMLQLCMLKAGILALLQ